MKKKNVKKFLFVGQRTSLTLLLQNQGTLFFCGHEEGTSLTDDPRQILLGHDCSYVKHRTIDVDITSVVLVSTVDNF